MSNSKLKQQSFGKATLILLFATVVVKLIGALFKIPLSSSNCLGDVGFGYFSYGYDLFSAIYALAMAGLPVAVSRIIAESYTKGEYGKISSVFKTSIKLYTFIGIAATALLIILALPLGFFAKLDSKFILNVLAMAPAVFFSCVASSYRGYYEGLSKMYPPAISQVVEALGKLILGYGFAAFTVKITGNVFYGASAAILGITIGTGLSTLYLKLYNCFTHKIFNFKSNTKSSAEYNREIGKKLFVLAVPIAITSLISSFVSLADVFTVKSALTGLFATDGDTIREMYYSSIMAYNEEYSTVILDLDLATLLYGIRGKAFTIYNLIPSFTTAISISAVPVFAAAITVGDKLVIKEKMNTVIKTASVISFPAAFGLMVAGPRVMGLLYDSMASYQIGGPLIQIFGIAALFAGFSVPLTALLQACGAQKAALVNIALGAVLKVAANLLLIRIPNINIMGAAIGTLICYFVIFVLDLIVLIRKTGVKLNLVGVFCKPIICALLSSISAYFVLKINDSSIITVVALITAVLVYLVFTLLFKTLKIEELGFSSTYK